MIVIVSGLPGAGKSYFAEKLAQEIGAAYINSDQVRQSMHAFGRYSLADRENIYQEMLRQTKTMMNGNRDVVVDATFSRQGMRDAFSDLATDTHNDLRVIQIVAAEPLIQQRLKRKRAYSEANFQVYQQLKAEFEEITMPHLTIESADHNISFMLEKGTQYLRNERD